MMISVLMYLYLSDDGLNSLKSNRQLFGSMLEHVDVDLANSNRE